MMKHLACIMDGNRRWAKQRGKLSVEGHKEGVETVKRAVRFCIDKKIQYLTLYTFSLENFKRPEVEKIYLFDLIATQAQRFIDLCGKDAVRIRFVGDRSLFPSSTVAACERIERDTAHGNALTVNILFCYGGQQEIVAGVKSIVSDIQRGALSPDDIDVTLFKKHLWMDNTPEPELIIRTGGYKRLSNFLLFHAAYSELYFLDCMWPDLTENELEKAVEYYEQTQRNMGV
jgi:undecaprenyl diphosphate synthase